MKVITGFLLGLVIFSVQALSAGNGPEVGFRGGYSLSTQYGIIEPDLPYTVDVFYRHGISGALLLYFPLTETFGIQQEFALLQKGSIEDITLKDRSIITHTEYDLNYFEMPVLLRYRMASIGGFDLYGSSGFALSILLGGEYRLSGSADINGAPVTFADTDKIDEVDIFDYAFLYGAGLEKEMFGRRCFFDYRFTIGWNILNMPTAEGEAPAPLRNQNYQFSFGFYY